MNENMEQMRKRHKEEMDKLQNNCKHIEISGWVSYYWAPGHAGLPVKICNFCEKIVKRRK